MQYISKTQLQPVARPDYPTPAHENEPAEVEGSSTSAEHLCDLRRTLLDNFGDLAQPTGAWASRQLSKASPCDGAPRYVIRDHDSDYGALVRARANDPCAQRPD